MQMSHQLMAVQLQYTQPWMQIKKLDSKFRCKLLISNYLFSLIKRCSSKWQISSRDIGTSRNFTDHNNGQAWAHPWCNLFTSKNPAVDMGNLLQNIGLGLFNDDTCPSGHISRPTQVNVSQELLSFSKKLSYTGKCASELLSFSKQLLKFDHIVHVWGLVEANKLHQFR